MYAKYFFKCILIQLCLFLSYNVNAQDENEDKKESTPLVYISKYDFIPGEKVIAFQNFENVNIGDFPAQWKSDASGEVVTVSNAPGKWLMLKGNGYFVPEYIKSLPNNFTVEYDLIVVPETDFAVEFYTNTDGAAFNETYIGTGGHIYSRFAQDGSWIQSANWKNSDRGPIDNSKDFPFYNRNFSKPMHISISRQNERIRFYINETKVVDIPTFLPSGNLSNIRFQNSYQQETGAVYISNLRIAVGAPDTRNKLLTEGKFVTTGINFDINSDKLKPTSYGVLKEIAAVLNENANVNIKIVGHTDSDGDDAKNLDLSKRRAASVKAALSSEFKIDESRIQTEGKGETQPVDKNATIEGKANNRRVEFIKM